MIDDLISPYSKDRSTIFANKEFPNQDNEDLSLYI